MKKRKAILLLVIFLAATLRFYKLGQIPPALDVDEAPIAYNAYSVLKTGRDEYGQRLPLSFRMLDDYRPPLYTYLAALSIGVFGPNEFAVRLPSAIAGTFIVLLFYFLTRELFKKSVTSYKLQVTSSLLLAISPWAVHFSRFASEANLSLFFIILGIFWFLKARRGRRNGFLSFSALSFALVAYSYQAARIFAVLMMLLLTLVFLRPFKKNLLKILLFFGLSLLLVLPLVGLFLKNPQESSIRFRGISFLSQDEVLEVSANRILLHQEDGKQWLGQVFDNRRLFYLRKWLRFYLDYFNPIFLFFGFDRRHQAPDVGHFYFLDGLFLLLGILLLRKRYAYKKLLKLLLLWTILAPVGAAFVWGGPRADRGIFMFLGLLLLIGLGAFDFLKRPPRKRWLRPGVLFLYLFNFLIFLDSYFVHLPLERAEDWNWHYKMAALESKQLVDNYSTIVVSSSLDFAHLPFLFYLQYDPHRYLEEGGTVSGMFTEQENRAGKYYFCALNQDQFLNRDDVLFIGQPGDFSFFYECDTRPPIIKRIKDWQGEDLIWLVEGVKFEES